MASKNGFESVVRHGVFWAGPRHADLISENLLYLQNTSHELYHLSGVSSLTVVVGDAIVAEDVIGPPVGACLEP